MSQDLEQDAAMSKDISTTKLNTRDKGLKRGMLSDAVQRLPAHESLVRGQKEAEDRDANTNLLLQPAGRAPRNLI